MAKNRGWGIGGLALLIGGTCSGAIALLGWAEGAIATPQATSQSVPETVIDAPVDAFGDRPLVPPTASPSVPTVTLTLPDLLNLVVEGNRDLRGAALERLIDQQELEEAESRFEPRLTSEASTGITQTLSTDRFGTSNEEDSAEVTELGDRTTLRRRTSLTGELLTPLGTQLEASLSPLSDDQVVTLTVTQPLLRGFGRSVNMAPVSVARLVEQQNQLALRQTVIDTVTVAVIQYNGLIRSQQAVQIQAQALLRRQRELEITQALVEAGRRARIDLLSNERSVAEAERQLIEAQNALEQANTDLLNQIGTDEPLRFAVSPAAIAQLYSAALERAATYEQESLVAIAYQNRPDYLQTQLDLEITRLNLLLAQDDRRWQLDVQSATGVGDRTETTLSLTLSRTLGDESLDTAVVRQEVQLQQQENQLAQLTETIRNDVTNQLNIVTTNRVRVDTAQREVETAQLQLQADQERFRRGTGNISLSDVINSEERLVNAQNAQLIAQIEFLNSVAELEQIVGITLEVWESQVDFAPLLM